MVTTRSQKQPQEQAKQAIQVASAHIPRTRRKRPAPSRSQALKPPLSPPPHPPNSFGLVQERYQTSLYALLTQAILWNQTSGRAALPVLLHLLHQYPTPSALAHADVPALAAMLHPIGLYNQRATRLVAFARAWIAAPPCSARRYARRDYPAKGDGRDARPGEVLGESDEREGWEVAHLPGVGPYAIDSFRIFYRDRLRGREGGEEEWRRVVPGDKDLRKYLVWRWGREGVVWDPVRGKVGGSADGSVTGHAGD